MIKKLLRYICILPLLFILFGSQSLCGQTSTSSDEKVVENSAAVDTAFKLLDEVKAANKFITKLDSLYTIDLPVGIGAKDKRDQESYAIIISKITIIDGQTFLDAYMAFTIPGTTKKIAFKGKAPITNRRQIWRIHRM